MRYGSRESVWKICASCVLREQRVLHTRRTLAEAVGGVGLSQKPPKKGILRSINLVCGVALCLGPPKLQQA